MKKLKNKNHTTGRREFISMFSAAAALGLIGSKSIKGVDRVEYPDDLGQSESILPTITLGQHRVSRLICGSNPISGYSYLGPHTDRQMKEYFTTEKAVELLINCEKVGITTHQFSARYEYIPILRDRGSRMNFISLASDPQKIKEVIEIAKPIAIVHHGGVSDRLFASGNLSQVHDFVKAVKDTGLLAGVSAHNPDVIKRIADEDWEVDFFMTCFYYLTRKPENGVSHPTNTIGDYNFYKEDPKIMTQLIRQVKKPCLGYKILSAGRLCSSQKVVRSAFQFAFENIKPTDGVIVGMFPLYFNEVEANAMYTKEFGKLKG